MQNRNGMKLINRLLRKNTSPSRVAGFIISNFIGLAIIAGGVQFYEDASSLWKSDDSFVNSDYLVVNKKVTSEDMLDGSPKTFSESETEDLRRQPWVRGTGEFQATDYRVWATVGNGGRDMETMLFFESIPDRFVDAAGAGWGFREGDREVPVIISKDYLTLYNFGFAGSAGLPKISEQLVGGIPLGLDLSSDDGARRLHLTGRVVGFSNRLNTILVPESFMEWSNRTLGSGERKAPSRLIIDVSRPGDVAIGDYLEAHGLEVAGDKSGSSASYLLRVVTGIVLAVGLLITVLSLFILMLSVSLLMEKNRQTLHRLLMLGYDTGAVARPYEGIVVWASAAACVLAVGSALLLRCFYIGALEGLGASGGGWLPGMAAGVALTVVIIAVNVIAVRRKVKASWRL